MASEYSMAIWKEPGQDMYAIIDTGVTKTSEIDLESSEAGFLFHPPRRRSDARSFSLPGYHEPDKDAGKSLPSN